MFKHKRMSVSGLLMLVALLAVLVLSACAPRSQASGAPMPPTPSGEDASGGQAYVEDVEIVLLESFPVQARAQIKGHLSDGCTELRAIDVAYNEETKTFDVTVETSRDPELMCTQALVAFEESVDLEVAGLSAGIYTVKADGETATFELAADNVLPADE